jgi:outer membrane receptor protein involved in Fe transport
MLKYFIVFTLVFIFSQMLISQPDQQRRLGGTISGTVIDSSTSHPIEYANIVVLSSKDTALVNGTVTGNSGKFSISGIKPGDYLVKVKFLGYIDSKMILELRPGKMQIDLGEIKLKPATINLGDVVVEGNKSPVSYEIDKKVVDVDQMQTVASGNAADVLENVPSVTVDIDGNVSLRGSTSFTVLVDGRPSVIDAQDILQQIPASSIDKIEIITNPSAKFDPEGSAGIINILMKKNKASGISGIVNANAGLKDKYGGDFLFEYKTNSFSSNFGLDYNKRFFPGTRNQDNYFILPGNTSYLNSIGNFEFGRTSYGLRSGIDFYLSDQDVLGFSGRYGSGDHQRNLNSNFSEWSSTDPQKIYYSSLSKRKRSGDFYSLTSNYQKSFDNNGHKIYSEIFISHDTPNESTITSEVQNSSQLSGKKTTEDGPSTEYTAKLEYTLPIDESNKFEAGYNGEFEKSEDNTKLFEFNNGTGEYEIQDQYSNVTKYDKNQHAFYTLYSNQINNFGYQLGFRAEYTGRKIEVNNQNQVFKIDQWDYFPGLHTTYKFDTGQQLMASYTRRIQRPRGWQLEPFETWVDANNVRQGNPALKPELIDSYEFGFQTFFGQVSFSSEFYYRVSHDKMEMVRSAYSEDVTLTTFDNVGSDYSLGTELMTIFSPVDFWDVNLMGNIYNYKIKGILYDAPFSRESFNWNSRLNNTLKISKTFQLQLNFTYNSPSTSAQGRTEGFFTSDLAAKKDLFDKLLSLTLQVRDIFGTAKREFTSTGPDFYNYAYFKRDSPIVMLNVRFNFNNFKQEKDRGQNGQEGGMDTGEDF